MKNNFDRNSLVMIDGKIWRPDQGYVDAHRIDLRDPKTGRSYLAPDENGEVGLLKDTVFEQMVLDGRATVITAPSVNQVQAVADMAEWDLDTAVKLDALVPLKLAVCGALDDSGVKNGAKAIDRWLADNWAVPLSKDGKSLAQLYGTAPPKGNTVKGWRSRFGTPGRRAPNQAVSMRGRLKGPFGDPVVHEVLMKHCLAHYAEPQVDYAEVTDDISTELEDISEGRSSQYARPPKPYVAPSYWKVRRHVLKLQSEMAETTRNGRLAARQKYEGGGSPLVADFPMEIVQIDHTPLPVFCVDAERGMVLGKPWLSIAIDVRTRVIAAHVISFMAPSVWTLGQLLLRMAHPKRPPPALAKRFPILPKIRGKADMIICDNGAEFRSHSFEHAAKSIGFSITFCPIKKPRYRAVVERAFNTIPKWIAKRLPGATRPIKETRLFGYNGEKLAFCLIDEVEAIANYVVAEYNVADHDGLDGRQPALVWESERLNRGIDNVANLDRLKIECLSVKVDVELRNNGIVLFGLRYHGARAVKELLNDLIPLECRRQNRSNASVLVTVKYDPQDISKLHVFNRKTKKHVILECDDPTYSVGMPLWFHEDLQKQAANEGADFCSPAERARIRSRRIQAIKQISPKAKADARARVAKLYEIPRLRQITGNLVHLHTEPPSPGDVRDFIAHDMAAETALDAEILAPRSDEFVKSQRKKDRQGRDRRDAGKAREVAPAPKPRRRDEPVATGTYE